MQAAPETARASAPVYSKDLAQEVTEFEERCRVEQARPRLQGPRRPDPAPQPERAQRPRFDFD